VLSTDAAQLIMDPSQFETLLIARLTRICGAEVASDTQLFTGGYLNSLRFVEVLAFVETTLGIQVPTSRLSAEHFQTPHVIVSEFCK
jgi:acyl carrier protein